MQPWMESGSIVLLVFDFAINQTKFGKNIGSNNWRLSTAANKLLAADAQIKKTKIIAACFLINNCL